MQSSVMYVAIILLKTLFPSVRVSYGSVAIMSTSRRSAKLLFARSVSHAGLGSRPIMLWGHPLRVDAFAVARGLGLAAFLVACRPSIGDPCVTSLDCSQQGDRLCDASQPAGYCTIFNCLPDQCPDNAACVGFGAAIDPKCTTYDPHQPRFEQTVCMKPC